MSASVVLVSRRLPRYKPALPAVLRRRAFALLFAGQSVSLLGDGLLRLALPFAVLSLGASAGALGAVLAAQTAPFAALSLVAGAWADRMDRRLVMLGSDLVRTATQAIAAALLLSGVATVLELGLLAAAYGAADAFFAPAAVGLVPAAAGGAHVQEANALLSTARNLSLLVGAPIGGVLVATVGAGTAVLADAATFAVSALCLAAMRTAAPVREEAPEPVLRSIAGGWHVVSERPWLRGFLGVLAAYHLIMLPCVFVLGPLIAVRELGGAGSWGIVSGAFGAGAVAGSLLALRLRPARPMRFTAAAMALASCQAVVIAEGGSTAVIAGFEAVTGVGVALGFALWETTLQQHVPEHALSRAISFDFLCSTGTLPVGSALIGLVAAAGGLRPTMVACTVVSVAVAGAYGMRRDVRALAQTG